MRRKTVLVCAAALTLALAAPGNAAFAQGQAAGVSQEGYEQGAVLVVFKDKTSKKAASKALRSVQAVQEDSVTADDMSRPLKYSKVQTAPQTSIEQAVRELEAQDAVAYAQPNYLYKVLDAQPAPGSQAAPEPPAAAEAQPSVVSPLEAVGEMLGQLFVQPQVTGTNDPLRYKQWYLNSVNSYKSWDSCKTDGSVTVAVLDTGITMNHVDLAQRIVAPYDVVGDNRNDYNESVPDDSPDDESGHGSHVAGIIAAQADNGCGTVGVSYNANIMPLKVCYYSTAANGYITSSEDLASAYSRILSKADHDANGDGKVGTYAQEYNVHVANMSLGALWEPMSPEDEAADKAVTDLVDRAERAGIVTVCAAGNESSSAYSWPSDYPACVSVIALDKFDSRASYSNFGEAKDISAPGSDIFSTVPMSYASQGTTVRDKDGNMHCYAELTGTSMASPVVAGIAAQVFAANPALTPAKVKEILYATAVDLGEKGFDSQFGHGKVDALAAVNAAQAIPATGIEDLPSSARAGEPLELSATVVPADASNKQVDFELVDDGGTAATLMGSTFTAAEQGTAQLVARIVHGGAYGADLSVSFSIAVAAAEQSGDDTAQDPNTGTGDQATGGQDGVGTGGDGGSSGGSGSSAGQSQGSQADKLKVSGIAASYARTGEPLAPKPTVTLGSAVLAEGVDYTLAYADNVEVGTAKVTLELIGNYSGSVQMTFKIVEQKAADAQGEAAKDEQGAAGGGADAAKQDAEGSSQAGSAGASQGQADTPQEQQGGAGQQGGATAGTPDNAQGQGQGDGTAGSDAAQAGPDASSAGAGTAGNGDAAGSAIGVSAPQDAAGGAAGASAQAGAQQTRISPAPATAASTGSTATQAAAKTAAKVKVPSVKVKSAKGKKKKLVVTWKKLSKKKASGYKVRWSIKKSMKGAKSKKVKKATKGKLTIKKVKSKKKYYVQVRAYKVKGGSTYWSKWSKPKKSTKVK